MSLSSQSNGMVIKSLDGGVTWGTEVSGLQSTSTVAMFDSLTGIAGDSSVYKTVTGRSFFVIFFSIKLLTS
jgi:hypothetical protein